MAPPRWPKPASLLGSEPRAVDPADGPDHRDASFQAGAAAECETARVVVDLLGQEAAVVDAVMRVLTERREIFRSGTPARLVREANGQFIRVRSVWLREYLSRHIEFLKSERAVDCPNWLPQFMVARADELPPVKL